MLTSLDFLQPGEPWPPTSERDRIQRYEDHRYLFENEHGKVFSEWIKLIRHEEQAALELFLNYPKRLSTLWADLLLGEEPTFTAGDDDSPEQEAVDALVADTRFIVAAYQAAIDASRYGDGLFKIDLDENQMPRIEAQPPQFWYPVVDPDNGKEVTAHVLAWTIEHEEAHFLGSRTEDILRVQIHERGRVENRAYRFSGSVIGEQIALDTIREGITESWETGIDRFLITHAPSLQTSDRLYGYSDYDDLFSILQELEIRLAQISRVLDKHADPSMYGPSNAVNIDPKTGEPIFIGGGRWFPVDDTDSPPGYITWDGQLTAAFEQIEHLMKQMYIISETSPAAFGQMQDVVAESGTALRRLMMVPLAKVNRVRLFFDPACREAIMTANALNGGPDLTDLKIEWHDGLPEDPREMAEIEQLRLNSGNTSIPSSVRRLDGGNQQSIQSEVDAIREDMAAIAGSAAGGASNLNLDFGGDDE